MINKLILKHKIKKYSNSYLKQEIVRLSRSNSQNKDIKLYRHLLCRELSKRQRG